MVGRKEWTINPGSSLIIGMLKLGVRLVAGFSTPKTVPIIVQLRGKTFTYNFAQGTKLAPNLERVRVPLDFECGFSCSCGTCPVTLSEADFEKVSASQPIQAAQQKVLTEQGYEVSTRLSCQLTVRAEMAGVTFVIEK